MRIKITLMVALVVLTAAMGSWAWQDRQRPSGAGSIGPNYGPPPPDQSDGSVRQIQQQPVQPGPRPAYQPRQGVPRTGYAGQPTYPYSPHHNPYYSGRSAGNVLSGLIDWIVGFPTNAMDRFSNFMDERVFPAAPATHGGSRGPNSDGPNARQARPGNADQLPPAAVYKPGPR